MKFLENKKILIIITGGIAAYKTLDLIRKLSKLNCEIKTILTKSGKEFVTPLSITSLSKNKICLLYTSPSPRDVEESRMPSSA